MKRGGNLQLLKASQLAEGRTSNGSEIVAWAAAAFLSDSLLPTMALNTLGTRIERVEGHVTDATTSPDPLEVCCGLIFRAGMHACWQRFGAAVESMTKALQAAKKAKIKSNAPVHSASSALTELGFTMPKLKAQCYALRAAYHACNGSACKARSDLVDAIALDPHNAQARSSITILLYRLGERDEALKHAQFMRDHIPASHFHVAPYQIAAIILLTRPSNPDITAKTEWLDVAVRLSKEFDEALTQDLMDIAMSEYESLHRIKQKEIPNTVIEDTFGPIMDEYERLSSTPEDATTRLSKMMAALSSRQKRSSMIEALQGRTSIVPASKVPKHVFVKEDGDQTPICGAAGDGLRSDWVNGMDFDPYKLNELLTLCMLGADINDPRIKAIFDKASAADLERRVSRMNFSPLILVVEGCRQQASNGQGRPMDHMPLLKYLVHTRKVNLEGRDVIGNTALFHALALGANEKTIAMAHVLVKAGANINMQNRFGCTAMHEAVQRRDQLVVRTMMELGADCRIEEYEGLTPLQMAQHWPVMFKVLADHEAKGQRKAAMASMKEDGLKCHCCTLQGKPCACMSIRYCGKVCQKSDWKRHKDECKAITGGDGFLTVQLRDGIHVVPHFATKVHSGKKAHSVRTVKIQVAGSGDPLMVYDKTRSFQKIIVDTEPGYNRIYNIVATRGVLGRKAYFSAHVSEESKAKGVDSLRLKVDKVEAPCDW
ncbi:hypothetical protein HDU78_008199 [Chytriomyces hyalinus]|nr:hypothetical protein HDU78_008199 [Chytriomyces hyalinus]